MNNPLTLVEPRRGLAQDIDLGTALEYWDVESLWQRGSPSGPCGKGNQCNAPLSGCGRYQLDDRQSALLADQRISKSAQTPMWSDGHRVESVALGVLKQSPLFITFNGPDTQM